LSLAAGNGADRVLKLLIESGANAKAAEYLDHLRRLQADFDNYRKRAARDQESLVARAGERIALVDLNSEAVPVALFGAGPLVHGVFSWQAFWIYAAVPTALVAVLFIALLLAGLTDSVNREIGSQGA
jgi:hypothetical protein